MTSPLQNFHQDFSSRRDSYTEKFPDILKESASHHLNQLFLQAQAVINRLQQVPMGFRTAQRNLLEAEAFLDYHFNYNSKVISTPSSSVTSTVGVFVYTQDNVYKFQSIGIRQWLIGPYEAVLQSRIKDIVQFHLLEYEDISLEPLPRTAPIFRGAASDIHMYAAIVNFGRNCIRFPDPFHAHALPEPLKLSMGPTRYTSQPQQALTP